MKKLIVTTVITFLFISCRKEVISKFSLNSEQSSANSAGFVLGQHYGGGVIFYIDNTGEHGLVAAEEDQGESFWYDSINTLTKAKGILIGTGVNNTYRIIKSQGRSGSYAATLCNRYKIDGYNDWFLPSKDELNQLFLNRTYVGNFVEGFYYWSSSEDSKNQVWVQNITTGFQGFYPKNYKAYVRAVRAF